MVPRVRIGPRPLASKSDALTTVLEILIFDRIVQSEGLIELIRLKFGRGTFSFPRNIRKIGRLIGRASNRWYRIHYVWTDVPGLLSENLGCNHPNCRG